MINKYPYKYDMHLHTSEGSRCGQSCAADMVVAHKRAGYTGIFVTDHAWGGNTRIDVHLPYREWVKEYSKGYYNALNEGDKQELYVFFGMEAGFRGTEFLIYGITPDWLSNHRELWDASIEEQYKIIHDGGGMISQAHPFREEYYIPEVRLFPQYADAIETANATHSSPLSGAHNTHEWDLLARELAVKENKPATAGSDVHSVNVLNGGVLFKSVKDSALKVTESIMSREDYILCDGLEYINLKGEVLGKF